MPLLLEQKGFFPSLFNQLLRDFNAVLMYSKRYKAVLSEAELHSPQLLLGHQPENISHKSQVSRTEKTSISVRTQFPISCAV